MFFDEQQDELYSQYSYGQQQVESLQCNPIKMYYSDSQTNQTLQKSIENIFKQENKSFLNVLLTDYNFLQLISNKIHLCKIGLTYATQSQRFVISQYNQKIIILQQEIKNSYIDVLISNNIQYTNNIIKTNYVKYIFQFNSLIQNENYKPFKTNIINCFFHLNKFTPKIYFDKLNMINTKDTIVTKIKQSVKPNVNILNKTNDKEQEKIQSKNVIPNNSSNINYQFIENKISVIIPTFKNQKLKKCLRTIEIYTPENNYLIDLIISFDGSTLQHKKIARQKIKTFKKMNINYIEIASQQRTGYISTINQGIKVALQNKSQYIYLVHDDVEFTSTWLNLIDQLRNNNANAAFPLSNSQYVPKQSLNYFRNLKLVSDFPPNFYRCKTHTINDMLSKYENNAIQLNESILYPELFFGAFQAKVFKQIGLLNTFYKQGFGQHIEFINKMWNENMKVILSPSVYIPHGGRQTFKLVFNINYPQYENTFVLKKYFNQLCNGINPTFKKKTVIYSAITNGYDTIHFDYYNTDIYDYILFLDYQQEDKQKLNIDPQWKIFNINTLKPLIKQTDKIKLSRYFKTHPHVFFKNYQNSIWVDGNINITKQVNNLIEILQQEQFMLIPSHPKRTSVFHQAEVAKSMAKDLQENINTLIEFLKNNNFKDNSGLIRSSVIFRKHKNKNCIKLMEMWWECIQKLSHYDQLTFNYCLQTLNYKTSTISWNILQSEYIKINKHN